jgi:uncharacterized peroxidase-related enzyme
MPYFPSIEKSDRLANVFAKFNTGVEKPLMQLHQILMRAEDSPFSVGERELIAAYVSGVASCQYCSGSHGKVAEQFGIEAGIIQDLLEDVDKSGVADNLKPIFKFVKIVTLDPTKIVQADIDAVLDAGWSERALYDALMVCCTFSFVNRMVGAIGLEINPDGSQRSLDMLMKGYGNMIDILKLK